MFKKVFLQNFTPFHSKFPFTWSSFPIPAGKNNSLMLPPPCFAMVMFANFTKLLGKAGCPFYIICIIYAYKKVKTTKKIKNWTTVQKTKTFPVQEVFSVQNVLRIVEFCALQSYMRGPGQCLAVDQPETTRPSQWREISLCVCFCLVSVSFMS